jgi:hypothetical protein
MLQTITIRVPKIRIEPAHSSTWDADDVGLAVFVSILLLGFGIFVIGGAIWCFTKLTYRPKTVVKWESSLSMEKQAYDKQCETNSEPDGSTGSDDDINNGIPNTTVNPWTCTYAH